MHSTELRRCAGAMREAINEALRRMRPAGTCLVCKAADGVRHTDHCAAWPLIEARSAYVAAVAPEETTPAEPAAQPEFAL